MVAAPFVHTSYLLSKVGKNVVFITNPEGSPVQGSATGFEVKAPSGKVYTLTNAHVCEMAKDGLVMVGEKQNSNRLVPKRVIEIYSENDLCLVEGLDNYEGLTLANDYQIEDYNYALGYPLGEALNLTMGFLKESTEVMIHMRNISPEACVGPHLKRVHIDNMFGPVDVCMIIRKSIATSITIFPGNSGSPMFNIYGNVTGVIFASNNSSHWGHAVPLEDVVDFLSAY